MESVEPVPSGQILQVVSDATEFRFDERILTFTSSATGENRSEYEINKSQRYQTILGWGGAFTDSAGINIDKLSVAAQDLLLRSYYHPDGLNYNTGRVNIGGCDFSPRTYTYVDTPGDVNLITFALQEEDIKYKIPFILQAQQLRQEPIKLFASAWTAPPWMKSNNDYSGRGFLLPQYYQPWADYYVKFFQSYRDLGVDFWGLTTQNEPEDGNIPGFSFNCMGWNASTQLQWVVENLGPTLEDNGFGHLNLMIFDDQRPFLVEWANEVLSNPQAFVYVDGIAVHWYSDDYLGVPNTDPLDETHANWPDKYMLYTEACTGYYPWEHEVLLGFWGRGQQYLQNIIEDLNHHVVGWTDWNLALDLQGGPNWAENYVDAPVIVNETANEFYKQPMYYALGHVSKFVPPGSIRIQSTLTSGQSNLDFVALETPDGGTSIVIQNRDDVASVNVSIFEQGLGYINVQLEPSSMHTLLYW